MHDVDTRLNRIAAIKALKGDHTQFRQEARAIAALKHAHIRQLYDPGPNYLMIEYDEGQHRYGFLRLEEALQIAIQMRAPSKPRTSAAFCIAI